MSVRCLLLSSLMVATSVGIGHAQGTTVNYSMTIAGLPIGSATMVLTPNGTSTAVSIKGHAGGPFEIGRMSATASISAGQIQVQSQSGSGKSASSATLVSRGAPGSSVFSYNGQTDRGPAKIAMTLAGGRATTLDVAIPDNPNAVRVPVTDAHKTGVVDPLSLLGQIIRPGGSFQPDTLCGRSNAVFSGQSRYNLTGTTSVPALAKGLPPGWSAVSCRVTFTPVSGHRIDKNADSGKSRVATLVFAQSEDRTKNLLWSLSVPATIGSFALTARSLQ
jgi:hypothetical protein